MLQLVAFSADARRSLVTILGRRPGKAAYYRAAHLPTVDQDAMKAIRDAWFEEQGGAPAGVLPHGRPRALAPRLAPTS